MNSESRSILEREEKLNEIRSLGIDSVILAAYEAELTLSDLIRRQEELNSIQDRGRTGEIGATGIVSSYSEELIKLQNSIQSLDPAATNYAADLEALTRQQLAINDAKERELELILETRKELLDSLRMQGVRENAGNRLAASIESLRSQIEDQFNMTEAEARELRSEIGSGVTQTSAGIMSEDKYNKLISFGLNLLANTSENFAANQAIVSMALTDANTAISYFTTELEGAASRLKALEYSDLLESLGSWGESESPMKSLQTTFQGYLEDFASLVSEEGVNRGITYTGNMTGTMSASDFTIAGTLTETENQILSELIAGFNRNLEIALQQVVSEQRSYANEIAALFYENNDRTWMSNLLSLQNEIYEIRISERDSLSQQLLIEQKILQLNKAQKEEIDEIKNRNLGFDNSAIESIQDYIDELKIVDQLITELSLRRELTTEESNTLKNAIEKERELSRARERESKQRISTINSEIFEIGQRGFDSIISSLGIVSQYAEEMNEAQLQINAMMDMQTELSDQEFETLQALQKKQEALNNARQREINLLGQQTLDLRTRLASEGTEQTQRESIISTVDGYVEEISKLTGFESLTSAEQAASTIGTVDYAPGGIPQSVVDLMDTLGITITNSLEDFSKEIDLISQVFKSANTAVSFFANDMGGLMDRLQNQAANQILKNLSSVGVEYTELDQINLRFIDTIEQITSLYSVVIEIQSATEDVLEYQLNGMDAQKEKVLTLMEAAINARQREIDLLQKRNQIEELNRMKSFFGLEEQEMTFTNMMDSLRGLQDVIESLDDTAKDIMFGTLNVAPNRDKLKLAQDEYSELLTEALTPNIDGSYNQEAISKFQGFVNQYLQMNQDFYKSSQDYVDIYTKVMSDIESVKENAERSGTTDIFEKFSESINKLSTDIIDILGVNDLTVVSLSDFISRFESITSDIDGFLSEDNAIEKFVNGMETAINVDTIDEWVVAMNGIFSSIDVQPLANSFIELIDNISSRLDLLNEDLLDQITGGYVSVGSYTANTGSMSLSVSSAMTAASNAGTANDKFVIGGTADFSEVTKVMDESPIFSSASSTAEKFEALSDYANIEGIGMSGNTRTNDLMYFKDGGEYGIAQISSSASNREKAQAYQALAEKYGFENVHMGGTGSPVNVFSNADQINSTEDIQSAIATQYGSQITGTSGTSNVSASPFSPSLGQVYNFGSGGTLGVSENTLYDPAQYGFSDFSEYSSRYQDYYTRQGADGSFVRSSMTKDQVDELTGKSLDEYLYSLSQLGFEVSNAPTLDTLAQNYSQSAFSNATLYSDIAAKQYIDEPNELVYKYAGENDYEVQLQRLSQMAGTGYEDNFSQFRTDFEDYYTANIGGQFYRSAMTKNEIDALDTAEKVRMIAGMTDLAIGTSDVKFNVPTQTEETIATTLGVSSDRWQDAIYDVLNLSAPIAAITAEDNENYYSYAGNPNYQLDVQKLSNQELTRYAGDWSAFTADNSDYFVSKDSEGQFYRSAQTKFALASLLDSDSKNDYKNALLALRALYNMNFNVPATGSGLANPSDIDIASSLGSTEAKIEPPSWGGYETITISRPEHSRRVNDFIREVWAAGSHGPFSARVLNSAGGYSYSDSEISSNKDSVIGYRGKMYVLDTNTLSAKDKWAIGANATILKGSSNWVSYSLDDIFSLLSGSEKITYYPTVRTPQPITVPANYSGKNADSFTFSARQVWGAHSNALSAAQIQTALNNGWISAPSGYLLSSKLNMYVPNLSSLGGLSNKQQWNYQQYTGINFGITEPSSVEIQGPYVKDFSHKGGEAIRATDQAYKWYVMPSGGASLPYVLLNQSAANSASQASTVIEQNGFGNFADWIVDLKGSTGWAGFNIRSVAENFAQVAFNSGSSIMDAQYSYDSNEIVDLNQLVAAYANTHGRANDVQPGTASIPTPAPAPPPTSWGPGGGGHIPIPAPAPAPAPTPVPDPIVSVLPPIDFSFDFSSLVGLPMFGANYSGWIFADGGYLNGPSHAMGGMHIEAEGGEYVVNKKAVSSVGVDLLDYINSNGKLPFMSFGLGGYIEDGDLDTSAEIGLAEVDTDSEDIKAILLELIKAVKEGDKKIVDSLGEIEPDFDVSVYTDLDGEFEARISAFKAELRDKARRGLDFREL
jgi:hypothetical protein